MAVSSQDRQSAADRISVAIMRVRADSVAAEADVLLRLGRHPHLVRFFGICRDGEEDLLVTELAPEGSLSDLMMRLDDQEEPAPIPAAHKLAMLQQVASGMTALANVKLFHRDLAARNVLVFSYDGSNVARTLVKVSDFGLAIKGYMASHRYVQDGDRPTRYLPPEALRKGRYSEKSDVWAFGVLAWELYTDGDVPYFAVADDAIVDHVCLGHRLARPTEDGGCTDSLWRVITSCWEERPNTRPTFVQLAILLGQVDTVAQPPRDVDDVGGDAPAGAGSAVRVDTAGPAPLPPSGGDNVDWAGLDALMDAADTMLPGEVNTFAQSPRDGDDISGDTPPGDGSAARVDTPGPAPLLAPLYRFNPTFNPIAVTYQNRARRLRPTIYSCSQCSREFSSRNYSSADVAYRAKEQHERDAHPQWDVYTCNDCGREFSEEDYSCSDSACHARDQHERDAHPYTWY